MSDLINRAREMLDLEYEDAREDAEALADVAVRLAKVINDHQKVLDQIKPVLRNAAREVSGTDRYHWKTDAGSTSVTFPDARWKARKGTDWEKAQRDLGDAFDNFFDTRVSYSVRKDIAAKIKRRTASENLVDGREKVRLITYDLVGKVMNIIEREEPTPRVGFKPN